MGDNFAVLAGAKNEEGSIRNWLNHAEIPSATVIDYAEAFIFRELRVMPMRTLKTGTIALDATAISLADDRFLDPISAQLTGDNQTKLVFKDQGLFEELLGFAEDGTLQPGPPNIYTHNRDEIYLNTKADQAYTYRIWHYAEPERLSGTNNDNILTTKYSDLLQSAWSIYAYKWLKDDKQMRAAQADTVALIKQANRDSDMALSTSQYEFHTR